MRSSLLLLALLVCPVGLSAQTPDRPAVPGSPLEHMAAMARELEAGARTSMNPVATALEYRADLGLSDAQVASLEPLSQQTSTAMERMMARAMSSVSAPVFDALSNPSTPIDEAAVRAAYCEQSAVQADYMIASMRAQRGLDQILTEAQREKLMTLQMNASANMLRGLFGVTPQQ